MIRFLRDTLQTKPAEPKPAALGVRQGGVSEPAPNAAAAPAPAAPQSGANG
jgi:hypothetical protein